MDESLKIEQRLRVRALIIGILAALVVFVAFGMISVLIKNPFFIRMTPVSPYDYIFLVLTSLLSGAYTSMWYYTKRASTKCNYAATSGAVGGLFSFGCPICNKLIVLLLGINGALAYFAPLQPILGVISVVLMAYAVYVQSRLIFGRGMK